MTKPIIVQKSPFAIKVDEGKNYFWCSCGQSKNQPFCDGAHKGSDFLPKKFEATATKTVYFCGCKHSQNGALCDGTHSKLDA
jgi:CDGSH iron-sulfur domain-containing protein 3